MPRPTNPTPPVDYAPATSALARTWAGKLLAPVFVLVAAGVLLEAYVRVANVPAYLLPKPSAVGEALLRDRDDLLTALLTTAEAALAGFAASAVIGVLAAVGLSGSTWVRRAFYPYTVFFQTVPIVAVAPLLTIWFQAGFVPVAVCAFIVSVFPVIANTLAGLLSTEPALVDLFRLYGAGRVATLVKLRLPSALPSAFTGLRVAGGLAVIGTIVAEFFVGSISNKPGLGVMIASASKYAKTDRVFAAVLLASLLGLSFFGAVNLASWITLRRWHASER